MLEERIKLRDDQLSNKLASTPPAEAKAMIEALEARLDKLSPRRLSEDKRNTLMKKLRLPLGSNYRVAITHDAACVDCNSFAAEFSAAFTGVGWQVQNGMGMGLFNMPLSGIAVRVANTSSLTQIERQVVDAIGEAQITFDLQDGRKIGDVELLITAKGVNG